MGLEPWLNRNPLATHNTPRQSNNKQKFILHPARFCCEQRILNHLTEGAYYCSRNRDIHNISKLNHVNINHCPNNVGIEIGIEIQKITCKLVVARRNRTRIDELQLVAERCFGADLTESAENRINSGHWFVRWEEAPEQENRKLGR